MVADGRGGGRQRGFETRFSERRSGGQRERSYYGSRDPRVFGRGGAYEDQRRTALGRVGTGRSSDPHDRSLAGSPECASAFAIETLFRGGPSQRLVGHWTA